MTGTMSIIWETVGKVAHPQSPANDINRRRAKRGETNFPRLKFMSKFTKIILRLLEQCGNEIARGEVSQVFDSFTDSDQFDRYLHFFLDSKYYPAFCSTVKFSEHYPRKSDGFIEDLCLAQGILTGSGVYDKEFFVGRVRHSFLDHSINLFQLIHELPFCVKSAGC